MAMPLKAVEPEKPCLGPDVDVVFHMFIFVTAEK